MNNETFDFESAARDVVFELIAAGRPWGTAGEECFVTEKTFMHVIDRPDTEPVYRIYNDFSEQVEETRRLAPERVSHVRERLKQVARDRPQGQISIVLQTHQGSRSYSKLNLCGTDSCSLGVFLPPEEFVERLATATSTGNALELRKPRDASINLSVARLRSNASRSSPD